MWLCASAAHTGCVSACVWESESKADKDVLWIKKVSSSMSGLIPLNLFSLFESKLIIASVNDGVIKKNITTVMQCTHKDCSYCHFICPPLSVCSPFYFLSFWARLSLSYSWTNSNRTSVTSGKNQRVLLLWMQISKIFSKNGWSAKETTKKLFIIL